MHEITLLVRLVKDMSVDVPPVELSCDNQSTLHIVGNPIFVERTKHIEWNFHLVFDKVFKKYIKLRYISTKEHRDTSHNFTNLVSQDIYEKKVFKLGVVNLFITQA